MPNLRDLRHMAGWTQTRTSCAGGIHRAKLSMAECGEITLSAEEEAAVRKVLLTAIRERELQIQTVLTNTELVQANV